MALLFWPELGLSPQGVLRLNGRELHFGEAKVSNTQSQVLSVTVITH
jgi:hypothetical protein